MRNQYHKFIRRKQRNRRIGVLLLLTLFMAATMTLVQECSQSFDGPYNKEYRPVDQKSTTTPTRDLR